MLELARKAFAPARIPFPVMHVDTGLNFPDVLEFRDKRVAELGVQLIVASVPDAIAAGHGQGGAQRLPQPDPDAGAARRRRGARLHRPVRRRPPRRGQGAGQGAGVLLPRRVRPVGPEEPAPRALGPLQRPDPPRRVDPGLPAVELDRARHLAVHRPRADRDPAALPRARSGTSSSARGCSTRSTSSSARATASRCAARPSATAPSATRTSPPPSSPTATTVEEVIAEIAVTRHDRARRHPRRRQGQRRRHGGPEEGGLLLMAAPPSTLHSAARRGRARPRRRAQGHPADRHRRLGGRRQEHADRPPALRQQGDLRGPVRGGRAGQQGATTSTSRCSPTACAPSASRASPSTSPTGTSAPRGARSSWPTPPGTCSTPGTWSPAPRPPTWRSCWSTPARACSSRAAGTPSSPRCCGCRTWSSRSTRWTSSTGRRPPTRRSATSSPRSRPSSTSPT